MDQYFRLQIFLVEICFCLFFSFTFIKNTWLLLSCNIFLQTLLRYISFPKNQYCNAKSRRLIRGSDVRHLLHALKTLFSAPLCITAGIRTSGSATACNCTLLLLQPYQYYDFCHGVPHLKSNFKHNVLILETLNKLNKMFLGFISSLLPPTIVFVKAGLNDKAQWLHTWGARRFSLLLCKSHKVLQCCFSNRSGRMDF